VAVDYFLKINGIEGESKDAKHPNEIHLDSWSWGETQQGSFSAGGGGGAGRVQMQDFHFSKPIDKSSPKLMLACATGEHIPDAVCIARKAGKEQQEYMKIKFTDLLISSYQTGGQAAGDLPMDQISFNFAKIELEYKEQKEDGTLGGAVSAGYDLKKNQKV
jgi:type VI secretion system secreted protein Hcp